MVVVVDDIVDDGGKSGVCGVCVEGPGSAWMDFCKTGGLRKVLMLIHGEESSDSDIDAQEVTSRTSRILRKALSLMIQDECGSID